MATTTDTAPVCDLHEVIFAFMRAEIAVMVAAMSINLPAELKGVCDAVAFVTAQCPQCGDMAYQRFVTSPEIVTAKEQV